MISSLHPLVSAERIDGGWSIIWEPDGSEFPRDDDLEPKKKGQISRVGGGKKFVAGTYQIIVTDEELEQHKHKAQVVWGKSSDALAAIVGHTSDKMIAADAAVEKLSLVAELFKEDPKTGEMLGERTIGAVTLLRSDKESSVDQIAVSQAERADFFDRMYEQQMGEGWRERISDPDQGQIRPTRILPAPIYGDETSDSTWRKAF